MKRISDSMWIIIGMIAGIVCGLVFGPSMGKLKFIGDIFLRMIQMGVVVLVLGAIIEAVGSLKAHDLGTIGIRTLIIFTITTVMAALFGLLLVNLLQPGAGLPPIEGLKYTGATPELNWASVFTNFFPTNIINAMSNGQMVQIIAFGLFFGVALSFINQESSGANILRFVCDFNVVIAKTLTIVMKLAPIGVFALLGWVTGVIGLAVILPLAKFLLSLLLAAILTYLAMVLPVCAYAKISPITFTRKLGRMGMIAFSTTSAAVALPAEMEDSEKLFGVSPRVNRLVAPLGFSLSSAGIALYLAVASMTMYQFFNLDMSFATQFNIVLISSLATLGAGIGIPGGSLVALAVVFPPLGLPLEGIALLAGVDRFADMIRTPMNVFCDMVAAVAVAASIGELDRDIFNAN